MVPWNSGKSGGVPEIASAMVVSNMVIAYVSDQDKREKPFSHAPLQKCGRVLMLRLGLSDARLITFSGPRTAPKRGRARLLDG